MTRFNLVLVALLGWGSAAFAQEDLPTLPMGAGAVCSPSAIADQLPPQFLTLLNKLDAPNKRVDTGTMPEVGAESAPLQAEAVSVVRPTIAAPKISKPITPVVDAPTPPAAPRMSTPRGVQIVQGRTSTPQGTAVRDHGVMVFRGNTAP